MNGEINYILTAWLFLLLDSYHHTATLYVSHSS